MKNFKAVVFDLDGTLLNTIEDLGNSMNTVLEANGFPVHSIDDYKYFIGRGIRNLVISVLPENHRDEKTISHCLDKMFQEYGSRWDQRTQPYDGISELLNFLSAHNIKMAILSNKGHELTIKVVEKYLAQWHFEAVFGERPGIPRKPDPAGALEIIKILGIPPSDIIYLGDSGSDMETAERSGMFPAGALWGYRDADELLTHGARFLIQTPQELMKLLT